MVEDGVCVGIMMVGCATDIFVLLLLGADWRRRIYHGRVVQNGSGAQREILGVPYDTYSRTPNKTSDPVTLSSLRLKCLVI